MAHVKTITRTPKVASTALALDKYVNALVNFVNQKASSLNGAS